LRLLQSKEETFCDWSIFLIYKSRSLAITPKFRAENLKKQPFSKAFNCLPQPRDLRLASSDRADQMGAESFGKLRFGFASATFSVKRGLENQRV